MDKNYEVESGKAHTLGLLDFIAVLLVGVAIVLGYIIWQRMDKNGQDFSFVPLAGESYDDGSYTLSFAPFAIELSEKKKDALVKVSVIPEGSFSEPVSFRVVEIQDSEGNVLVLTDVIFAQFVQKTLKSSEFAGGAHLVVSLVGKAEKGSYVLIGQAISGGVEKSFIVPITVQ